MSANVLRATRPTIGLFTLLFAIGSTYLASLGYFLVKGDNFVDTEKTATATHFALSTQLALPSSLSFTTSSSASRTLATGWHQPETWGVWSSRANATILLPPIKDTSIKSACFIFQVGAMPQTKTWSMLVTVNAHPLTPEAIFHGTGPYYVQGNVPIQPNVPIHVQLAGPAPKIPNLMSRHTTDARDLAFRLLSISVTPQCTESQ